MGSIIIVLCSLLPLIDTVNGYFSGKCQIGSIYKIITLGCLIITMLSKKKKINIRIAKLLVFGISYVLFSILINVFFLGGSIISIDFPVKLIFNILLFASFVQCTLNGTLSGSSFYRILDVNSWVFIICFLLPYVLGLGNRIYAGGIGYKGYFISQNEMSFVLIILCFFSAYATLRTVSIKNVTQLLLLVLCGLLCNTKSTIIACITIVIIMTGTLIKRSNNKRKVNVGFIVLIGCLLLKNTIYSSIVSMLNRFNSLKTVHYGDSIITSILSGRNLLLEAEWQHLSESHPIINVILGNGFCSKYLIEMDFVDVFFFLGFIGLVLFFFIICWLFKKIKAKEKDEMKYFTLLSFLLLVGFMFFTGHVIFMAMSGCYFIICCCFLLFYSEENGDNKHE